MMTFYDMELDYFTKSAGFSINPKGPCHIEEAFLWIPGARMTFKFGRNEEFPKKENFALELAESMLRRKASGFIFRVCTQLTEKWPLPEGGIWEAEAKASVIVLRHPDEAPRQWATADVSSQSPWPEQEIKNKMGVVERTYRLEIPKMSVLIEVGTDAIPSEFSSMV